MKLSDYVVAFLEERAVTDVFLVSGGGIMYLLDSIGRSTRLKYHCNYHEQASAVAAEGYARATGKPGVCFATVGPGAINAISGIVGAWVDSVPVLVITGQVRTQLIADYAVLRQFGPQEANAVGVATPVTKYCVSVRDPLKIRFVLERAFHELISGRPGPVLIEIPLDIQNTEVNPDTLEGYVAPQAVVGNKRFEDSFADAMNAISKARRPLFIAGNGVRSARCTQILLDVGLKFNVPVVVPFTAKDLVPDSHPLLMGVFGSAGQRHANYAVQNADCVIAIGAGLNIQKVGFNPGDFARLAVKVFVDVDSGQLDYQAVKPDFAVVADAGKFLSALDQSFSQGFRINQDERWLEVCGLWREKYESLTNAHFGAGNTLTSYGLVSELSQQLTSDDILVSGNGIEAASICQGLRLKPGQRVLMSGWGSMGWDLPMTLGAYIAFRNRRVICICGDGSFQWNVQELLSISKLRGNIKIFVLNNNGYTAIRMTQDNLFGGRYVGADPTSGVFNPNFKMLSKAYGLDYRRVALKSRLNDVVTSALASQAPEIVEVVIDPKQGIFPKASSFKRADGTLESRPIEDMAPFLPRDEQERNMSFFR